MMRYLFLERVIGPRRLGLSRRRLQENLGRWAPAYMLLTLAAAMFQASYSVGLNVSSSLPHHVFLIRKGELPERGQYVAFRWHGGSPHRDGVTFVKLVAGVPGDTVTRIGREFFVNAQPVGAAKTMSRAGAPLEPGPTGVIPPDQFYVHAPHPDSLDSRYRLTGWISEAQIIGRAYALF